MSKQLQHLQGATIGPDGRLYDKHNQPTELWVQPGGHELTDAQGRVVGTITQVGAIYDRAGTLVNHVQRHDL